MAAVYAVLGFFNYPYASKTLANALGNFVKLIPLLALVFLVIFVVNIFLHPEAIKKHLGRESGKRGWLYAVLGSILISAPPYVLFPMLGELKKNGMRHSLIAVFMNNRHVQLPLLPVMAYYFGLAFTMIIACYILIFAVINGKIIGMILDPEVNE